MVAANQSDVSSAPAVNPLTPPAPRIISLSNPDPNGWAATSTPSFSWQVSSDVTATRLLYDENPDSVPSVAYNPPISSKTLSGIVDGVYYLHVQLQNQVEWEGISNYRFQIAPLRQILSSFPSPMPHHPVLRNRFRSSRLISFRHRPLFDSNRQPSSFQRYSRRSRNFIRLTRAVFRQPHAHSHRVRQGGELHNIDRHIYRQSKSSFRPRTAHY